MPLGLESLFRAVTKRARRGLYAGKRVLSGNNVSDDGGNRTRRMWKPNSQNKRLYSEILDKMVQLRVTTAALRNIDKAGGLDAYILGTSEQKLDSDVALQLKAQMLQQLATVAPKQQLQRLGASFAAQGVVVPSGSAGPTAAAQAPQQVQPVTS